MDITLLNWMGFHFENQKKKRESESLCYSKKCNYQVEQILSVGCSEYSVPKIDIHQEPHYHQKVVYLVLRESGRADLARC